MKAFLNWSGGKDSAYCLCRAQEMGLQIGTLLTSLSADTGRISMHGVSRELLRRQAAVIGMPLLELELPQSPDMQAYENTIQHSNLELKENGYSTAVFGDIFLRDLKDHQTQNCGTRHFPRRDQHLAAGRKENSHR